MALPSVALSSGCQLCAETRLAPVDWGRLHESRGERRLSGGRYSTRPTMFWTTRIQMMLATPSTSVPSVHAW